jgi:hypothetical protein
MVLESIMNVQLSKKPNQNVHYAVHNSRPVGSVCIQFVIDKVAEGQISLREI